MKSTKLLRQIFCILLAVTFGLGQIDCSSSYLARAKSALSSLHQSLTFGPTGGSLGAVGGPLEAPANQQQPQDSSNSSSVKKKEDEEKLSNPSIEILTSSEQPILTQTSSESSQSNANPINSISSTSATNFEPTIGAASVEDATQASTSETNQNKLVESTSEEAAVVVADTESPPATPILSSDDNRATISSKVATEIAFKEAELEAQAAVDASILNFGVDPFGPLSDSCYDEYGNARFCEPDFENAALERPVQVSSECGNPPSRFCTVSSNEKNEQVRNCHICDAQNTKKQHPAAYLTDLNSPSQPTCWVSAPIESHLNDSLHDNVTLVLNFDKKYEITYVSVQFCSLKPDSLAMWKTQDFGATWIPFQFYSSLCEKVYPKQLALCQNSTTSNAGGAATVLASSSSNSARVAYSPLADASQRELSNQLDWITATGLKIVLDRQQAAAAFGPPSHAHHIQAQSSSTPKALALTAQSPPSAVPGNLGPTKNNTKALQQATPTEQLENSLTSPSDSSNYAVADLTVGGRCKCNGHASRCIHSKDGRLQCDCRHNTAGRDCEKCASFHYDRPWARATLTDANPCQPCNCNGHSRKCRFDADIYKLSGKRSGGVCIKCLDNTAGRHCHYCTQGYTRDHSKPMSDKDACRPCDCHPIGSLGTVCNQTTGQCACKEGVTGLQCNQCAPGYQQSSSLSEPCIKLPENDINNDLSPTIDVVDQLNPNNLFVGQDQPSSSAANKQQQDSNNEISAQPINPNELIESGPLPPPPIVDYSIRHVPASGGSGRNSIRFTGDQNDIVNPRQDYEYMDQYDNSMLANRQRPKQPYRWHHQWNAAWRRPQNWYQMHPGWVPGGVGAAEPDEDDDDDEGRDNFYDRRQSYLSASGKRRKAHMRPSDEANLAPQDGEASSLDGSQMPFNSPKYNFAPIQSDENNFNQIAPNHRPKQQPVAPKNRHRIRPESNYHKVACGDCRKRKKSQRQFCRLDYALKATILSKDAADDWTKFDIEIQDIFKSPSSTSARGAPISTNYIDDMIQADEPDSNQNSSSVTMNPNQLLIEEITEQQQQFKQTSSGFGPRLKVGTIQPLWVPTEDLACRCPRLKPKTTYLLMGSIEYKDNTMTLQLDRHGSALEWMPEYQGKMMRYQQRLANKKC